MTDLEEELQQLGLSQYLEVLVAEGFDTWETVLDITESDLNFLNVKIGHRRPDEHAPERPPSAYVIFSNQVRASLKGQRLSFTEIAQLVGERWRNLPAEAREAYQRQAGTAKENYYTELAEYKKSSEYDAYQKYFQEFKAKHAAPHDG
ncbi:High mobility group protein B3 [Paraphaeosphaeria sporulosa]